eukprot:scaffold115_cov304-Prasinococcus_capsulatus_cf.AAC.5
MTSACVLAVVDPNLAVLAPVLRSAYPKLCHPVRATALAGTRAPWPRGPGLGGNTAPQDGPD